MASSWLFLNMLKEAHEADLRARAYRKKINRSPRLKSSAFKLLSDGQFVKRYGLTKELTRQLISEVIPLIPPALPSDALDVETKVLVALAFYATGTQKNMVGDSRNLPISLSHVSKAIREVTMALNKPAILEKYIHFPFQYHEREQAKERFYRKFKIPGVLGCIDGTQVALVRPAKDDKKYFNKKGYYSINAMIICDSDLNILSVDVSNPGSTQDSIVWKNHSINSYLGELQATSGEDLFLLGDSDYALSPTLMTPLSASEPDTTEDYQDLHLSARGITEKCVHALKARYRCLSVGRKLNYAPGVAGKIITACCVLHNVANKAQLPFTPLTSQELSLERQMTEA